MFPPWFCTNSLPVCTSHWIQCFLRAFAISAAPPRHLIPSKCNPEAAVIYLKGQVGLAVIRKWRWDKEPTHWFLHVLLSAGSVFHGWFLFCSFTRKCMSGFFVFPSSIPSQNVVGMRTSDQGTSMPFCTFVWNKDKQKENGNFNSYS